MSHLHILAFGSALVLLILLSAFFSAAETALMVVNRYRLRHKARLNKRSAILILHLIKRPDRLLGMILIGNCVSNIIASALATLLAVNLLGEGGVVLSTILLTFAILIFAEVAPKTVAALYSEKVAKLVAWPVFILLKLFYPFVWLTNGLSNGLLKLFNVKVDSHITEPFSREELRSIVYETSGRMPHKYQDMLLGILDLNKLTVNDVMVPHHEIIGIDLDWEWEAIQKLITQSPHDWLPLYRDDINQIIGMIHLRELMHAVLSQQTINKETLQKLAHEAYFVPENTPLNKQLLNFQREHKRTALIVDEYGEIQGLLTLADILEEIVGEFNESIGGRDKIIEVQADESYLVDGAITLRELNRVIGSDFVTSGPRTLSGLIVEYLESIPHAGTCMKINGYPIEILQVHENRVKVARIAPKIVIENTRQGAIEDN